MGADQWKKLRNILLEYPTVVLLKVVKSWGPYTTQLLALAPDTSMAAAGAAESTCRVALLDTSNHGEYDCYQMSCGIEACHIPYDTPFPPKGDAQCRGCGRPFAAEKQLTQPFFLDPCCGRFSTRGKELPPNPFSKDERKYPEDQDVYVKSAAKTRD
jgi:hypothetical protein